MGEAKYKVSSEKWIEFQQVDKKVHVQTKAPS